MSVIITGIDIPKNCIVCNHMGLQKALNCQLIYIGCANCGKHPDCPFKSADGLIEEIEQLFIDDAGIQEYSKDEIIKVIKNYCEVKD